MSTYHVAAQKCGTWWALTVEGPGLSRPAHTQVHRLDEAEDMVRDLLALSALPGSGDVIVAVPPDSRPDPADRNRFP
ncbi:hypothetical protein [Herbidospora yilanensis]|uniref:hypothetical protein n=1 Tax=Herbidospora yilanensis TaxID=354426 RepID=UPI000781BB6F|nr:hypothetical protein [Herbidospora yilanensis]